MRETFTCTHDTHTHAHMALRLVVTDLRVRADPQVGDDQAERHMCVCVCVVRARERFAQDSCVPLCDL